MSQHRQPAGLPSGGQFAAGARGEADVTLASGLRRDDLLASPELRDVPAQWLAEKTDSELAECIDGMRAARAAHEVARTARIQAETRERERRRRYRRPDWLVKDGDAYTTTDGYTGTKVQGASDGRATTQYVVRAPGGDQTVVSRVEEMADWIVEHRTVGSPETIGSAPLPAYRIAADEWVADRANNPDGWLADGEDLLALEEAAWDEERSGGDPVEAYRRAWRSSSARFNQSGSPEDAAYMVAIEREVEQRGATR